MKKIIIPALAVVFAGTTAYAADDHKTTTGAATNSGPGVQGPADTRTGPSTKNTDTGASGTSAGDSGAAQTGPGAGSTSPSQDSSGVAGAPGNKNGPASKEPSDKTR